MAAKKGLGRGLDALLYDNETKQTQSGVMMLRLSDIEPNAAQARKEFDSGALEELKTSILRHGLVQPIVVRLKSNGLYEIIAGERRWRACRMAGLSEVPCVVKDADDVTSAELSLVENLQRENLNPIEEADGYRSLMDNFNLTQEEAAERVGKSRAAVANILRLLKLPEAVRDMVVSGQLSGGHARTLVPLCGAFADDEVVKTAVQVASNHLSVRQTEQLVKLMLDGGSKQTVQTPVQTAYYHRLESRASSSLGRRVSIRRKPDGSGNISLAYSGTDDLEALMKALCGAGFFETEE